MTGLQIKIIAALVSALVFFGGAALIAKGLYDNGYRAAEEACEAQARKQIEAIQGALDTAARELEIERAKADKVRVERTATIREIYRDVPQAPAVCAPDPGALRVLDDALSDAAP